MIDDFGCPISSVKIYLISFRDNIVFTPKFLNRSSTAFEYIHYKQTQNLIVALYNVSTYLYRFLKLLKMLLIVVISIVNGNGMVVRTTALRQV